MINIGGKTLDMSEELEVSFDEILTSTTMSLTSNTAADEAFLMLRIMLYVLQGCSNAGLSTSCISRNKRATERATERATKEPTVAPGPDTLKAYLDQFHSSRHLSRLPPCHLPRPSSHYPTPRSFQLQPTSTTPTVHLHLSRSEDSSDTTGCLVRYLRPHPTPMFRGNMYMCRVTDLAFVDGERYRYTALYRSDRAAEAMPR